MPAETDAQAGQIDRAEVLRVIKDQLADILEIDGSTINEILGMIDKSYTMARERQVHAQFLPEGHTAIAFEETPKSDSDDDFEMFG